MFIYTHILFHYPYIPPFFVFLPFFFPSNLYHIMHMPTPIDIYSTHQKTHTHTVHKLSSVENAWWQAAEKGEAICE